MSAQAGELDHAMNERDRLPQAVLIAGPTASGKSALALAFAESFQGLIINADSMQVYRDLAIITARPTLAETKRVPHLLYGHIDAAENYSVGRYLTDARAALGEAEQAQRIPVFVGGTGLYFKALTKGLAAVPPTPTDIRAQVRSRLEAEGPLALHAELSRRDPATAARLKPADRTRVARALEVIEATGRSLGDWHAVGMPALLDRKRILSIFLTPDRDALYRRIDARFETMLAAGALEEVRALTARNLDPLLPAMKAHGIPWLRRYLAGEMTLEAAAEKAKQDTRQYAKRQFTWFRHQLSDWPKIPPEDALRQLSLALSSSGAQ
jgi:tRNA dimethylallyltransferase